MVAVRGSVIGFDETNRKLIVHCLMSNAVVKACWPADLQVDTGAVVDIQENGTVIYPASSHSPNERPKVQVSKKMHVVMHVPST